MAKNQGKKPPFKERWVRRLGNWLSECDWRTLVPYLLLQITGVLLVFSASSYRALTEQLAVWSYGLKQALFTLGAFAIILFVYRLNINFLKRHGVRWAIVAGITAALIYVLFFGAEINGAKGWIVIGSFTLQPIEFAKPALVVLLAGTLSQMEAQLPAQGLWSGILAHKGTFLVLLSWLGLAFFLPDIGGMALLIGIALLMLLASGIPNKIAYWLSGLGLLGYGALVVLVKVLNHFNISPSHYQSERLLTFVDPFRVAQGAGLQQVTSYYALYSGGWLGRGLGNSILKKGYLPEPHNDFIMAVVGEELGYFGLLLILGIYIYLIGHLLMRGLNMQKTYHQLLLYGTASYFLVQMVVNLGGITGLLPITGVTFPMISYGGSSVFTTAIFIGLCLSTIRHDNKLRLVQEHAMSQDNH